MVIYQFEVPHGSVVVRHNVSSSSYLIVHTGLGISKSGLARRRRQAENVLHYLVIRMHFAAKKWIALDEMSSHWNWRQEKIIQTFLLFPNFTFSKHIAAMESGLPEQHLEQHFFPISYTPWEDTEAWQMWLLLGTTYQKGKNIPNYYKLYQRAINIWSGRKLFQIYKIITTLPFPRPSKIYPN
jgi:hypothetical protein